LLDRLIGAFLGWRAVVITILVGCLLGATVGVGLIVLRRLSRRQHIPFGPFLALGGARRSALGRRTHRAVRKAAHGPAEALTANSLTPPQLQLSLHLLQAFAHCGDHGMAWLHTLQKSPEAPTRFPPRPAALGHGSEDPMG